MKGSGCETSKNAMIISIGGTPAPVIKTICAHKPSVVSFLASQDSFDRITEIKKGIGREGISIENELTLVDNVNDLSHCYQKAGEAIKRVLSKGFKKDKVIVDYTGGTKNMSVSLALASVSYGFTFSYVGGKERTKNGVGIVIDGQEEIYHNINPWDFLAVEECKSIAVLFNQYQFKAAKGLADNLAVKSEKFGAVYRKIGFLIEAYYMWDLFRHQDAIKLFTRARASDTLDGEDETIRSFANTSTNHLTYLKKNTEVEKNHLLSFQILDLFSNAGRRAEEGKVDDAILRLYRVVEMVAQERLINKYEIDTSNVRAEQIPASLLAEYIRRYKDQKNGTIKLPQTASYILLANLNDDLGKLFDQNQLRFKDIQSSRNNSYLAHGLKSSTEKTYEKLKAFILDLNVFKSDDVPTFPKLRF